LPVVGACATLRVDVRLRARFFATVFVLGCNGAPGIEPADDTTSGGPIDLPTPDFIEPAGGELHIDITRIEDVLLDVNANVGVTSLEVDGRSRGTLTIASSVGVFDAGRLRLFVRGAMVAGLHSMLLRTPDPIATETSELVTVFLDAVAAPTLAWQDGTMLDEGDALVVGGGDAAAPLGLVIDDVTGPQLRAWAPDGSSWAADRSRTVALPGHVVTTNVADVALARRIDADAQRLRCAWRTGTPGTGIGVVEVDWATDTDGVAIAGFAPNESWLGTREWVEIGRPILAADLVLAEVVALVDTEQPRPGDRTLAHTRFSTTALDVPRLVPFGTFDTVGAAIALDTLPGPNVAIAARMDHLRPAVIEIDRETSVLRMRPTAVDAREMQWDDVDGPMVTALGAFSSRIVAGLDRDGDAVVIAWLDDSGHTEPTLRRVDLPSGAPASGPVVAALVGGSVVLLVPRGAHDMLAIPTTSMSPVVQTLVGAACDVAVAGRGEPSDGASRVGVACLRERALVVGMLVVE